MRFLVSVLALLGSAVTFASDHGPGLSPGAALSRLHSGNVRFTSAASVHPHQTSSRRAELAGGQKPFAVIVGCSDSRTAPEVVFDQGLGDLFVVRTAGNVADDVALGSIEYAVEHLGSTLIVVLGHEKCGAVKAALDGGKLPGHLPAIGKFIRPAVMQTAGSAGDPLDNAVRANARLVAQRISAANPVLKPMVASGKIRVVAARYDLDSGRVEFLK